MNSAQKLSIGATCLLYILSTSAATAQTLQNGAYSDADFGEMEVSCVSPTSCVATYDDGEGFIYLTGTEQGGAFVGFWAEPVYSETCDAAREFDDINTAAWGTVELQLDASGNSWTGLSGECDGLLDWPFNGSNGQITDASSEELSSASDVPKPEESGAKLFAESNILATFYHEIAHALIDIERLPVFGQEEDAADVLSVILINKFYPEETAVEIINDTAALFNLYHETLDARGVEFPYWDTHGPDEQRYFNTICLFYGANPTERFNFATRLELPERRATRCEQEFELAQASWGPVLDGLAENGGGTSFRMITPSSEVSESGQWMASILESEISALNNEFTLSETLNVMVGSCGQSNAFYDPDQKAIIMCTELVEELLERFDVTLNVGNPTGSPITAPSE
jgi:hypothetical protein